MYLLIYFSYAKVCGLCEQSSLWSGKTSLLHPTVWVTVAGNKLDVQNMLDEQNKFKIGTGQIILYNQYFMVLYYSFIYMLDTNLGNRMHS